MSGWLPAQTPGTSRWDDTFSDGQSLQQNLIDRSTHRDFSHKQPQLLAIMFRA
jgi:hypothetical protein